MKCKLCHAELSAAAMKSDSKGPPELLCGACRHELSLDPLKKGEYFFLLKGSELSAAISRVGKLDKELALDEKAMPPSLSASGSFPGPGSGGRGPQIGFEIETTIRIRNSNITEQRSLDEKQIRTSFTWNKHVQAARAAPNDHPYDSKTWALTIDSDPKTKLDHIEYVTKPLDLTDAAHRNQLLCTLTDIADLSRYYYRYLAHKQGEAGSRMEHNEMWIALMHAMHSKKQTAWLEERFANSTLDLSCFYPGQHAYMVEGMGRHKSYTWARGRAESVHVAAPVQGSPQATVDIPIRRVFRFLMLMSRGALLLPSGKEVPLFRQESQADALRKIVQRVSTLRVNESQRGLIAMMAFYLEAGALQQRVVTFFKEAYPILNRCGFGKWLKLIATDNFREALPGHLAAASAVVIDRKNRMIPRGSGDVISHQNSYRQDWVESVIKASRSATGTHDERLMLNTKHGWWPVKDDQLLTFEIRGMPQISVEEWRTQLVGIYDWFEAFINNLELPAPAARAAPAPVAQQPAAAVVLPALYYDLKNQDRLDQQALDDIARLRQNHATAQHIERYLRQRFF